MNITTFKYTKADGKTSNRVIYVISKPSRLLSGVDISELDMEAQALYAQAAQAAKDAYGSAMAKVNEQFDVKHNFRQFDPSRMSEIIEEVM